MAQPPAFNRSENYTEYAAAHPGATFPPASLDGEMDDIETTLDATLSNLALIQRDDGKLANASVHPDALSAATKALMAAWNPRGLWATATLYAVRDVIEQAGISYVCAIAHTSAASFATDTAAGRWINLGTGVPSAANIAVTPVGGVAASNVQSAIQELDAEKANLASPALTGNPTAPTPAPGDNDTSIATTAFVTNAVSATRTDAQFRVAKAADPEQTIALSLTALTADRTLTMPDYDVSLAQMGVAAEVFTANGTFTTPANTRPTSRFKWTLTGGGAGGGGSGATGAAGGGGGAGATAIYYVTGLTANLACAVAVGTGGAGGGAGASAGIAGGPSSVVVGATTVTAGGGAAGPASGTGASPFGGVGGTATNGTINITGGSGGVGSNFNPTYEEFPFGGQGGASIYGSGGSGGPSANNGAAAGPFGAGGGGAGSAATGNRSGGAGRGGLVLVEYVI
jgi:hypothetical protein